MKHLLPSLLLVLTTSPLLADEAKPDPKPKAPAPEAAYPEPAVVEPQ
jgi:hypothetical protein